MARLSPYLTFDGNCRQAMEFYQHCLGGELDVQRLADSPLAASLPFNVKDRIVHATLTSDHIVLMGSDMAADTLVQGNTSSLILTFTSEADIRETFASLGKEGAVIYSLQPTFYGALFGHLTDKFGHDWLFNYSVNAANLYNQLKP